MSCRPCLIEIAGVAGAGKSTLTGALARRYGWQVADSLHTRARDHWPYVVHSLPSVIPITARGVANPPALSWDEVKLAVYVTEWSRFLQANNGRHGVTVLDQGPIFALACLLWGRKPVTRTAAFGRWLGEMVDRWSTELDAIVWLEAPGPVLVERIERREQAHEAKGSSAGRALELLAAHGAAYTRVLGAFDGSTGPPVLRFDTAARSPDEVAGELAEALGPLSTKTLTDVGRRLTVR